jgi:hypothetical protein
MDMKTINIHWVLGRCSCRLIKMEVRQKNLMCRAENRKEHQNFDRVVHIYVAVLVKNASPGLAYLATNDAAPAEYT